MPDYNLPGWSYEQQQVDSPAVATAPVPTAAPGMVTIGQEDWRRGGPGPVPVPEGQGIRLTGGLPFKPEGPLPWWTIAYEQEKQKMAEEERIRQLVQSVPFAQQSKALESAMRLEGNLGFAADIKAGVPIQQALAKHAGKIYYNAPSAHVAAMRQLTRPPSEAGYTLGQEFPIAGGRVIATGPKSGQFVPENTEKIISPDRQLSVINATIKGLTDEAEMADEARKAEIQADLLQLRRQQRGLVRQVTERPSAAARTGKSAPAIGTVVRGYEFIGGDPSKKESWKKVS